MKPYQITYVLNIRLDNISIYIYVEFKICRKKLIVLIIQEPKKKTKKPKDPNEPKKRKSLCTENKTHLLGEASLKIIYFVCASIFIYFRWVRVSSLSAYRSRILYISTLASPMKLGGHVITPLFSLGILFPVLQ